MIPENEPAVRTEVAGRDLEQARVLHEGGYNGQGFDTSLTERDFEFRYTITGDSDMSLRSSTFLGSVKGTIQPENEYVVSWITSGAGVYDIGGDETPLVIGRPAVFPTGKPFAFEFTDYRQNLIHFDAGFLERVAAEHEGGLPGPLHFDHSAVPDDAALRAWKTTLTLVAQTVFGHEATPLLRHEVNRIAAVAVLDTFPHESPRVPPGLLLPRNGRLRVAVEYLHAHSHLPLTTTSIAEASGLTVRGLQVAFSRHLETTPMGYLRDVRLERVRADLRNLGPTQTTVGAIAHRWGFSHLGRFSSSYAERFGELPAETLHSSAPRMRSSG